MGRGAGRDGPRLSGRSRGARRWHGRTHLFDRLSGTGNPSASCSAPSAIDWMNGDDSQRRFEIRYAAVRARDVRRKGRWTKRCRWFFFLTFVLVAGARGALRRYPSRAEQRVLVAGRRGAVRRGPRVDSDVIVLAQIAGVADGRCPAAAARGTTSMPLLRAPRSHLAVPALSVVDSDEIPDLAIRRRRVRVPGRQTRGRCGVDGDSCRHDARPLNPRPVPQILKRRKPACLSITPKTPLPRFFSISVRVSVTRAGGASFSTRNRKRKSVFCFGGPNSLQTEGHG